MKLRGEVQRLRNSQLVAIDLLADLEDHLQGKTTNSTPELLARLAAFLNTNVEVGAQPATAHDRHCPGRDVVDLLNDIAGHSCKCKGMLDPAAICETCRAVELLKAMDNGVPAQDRATRLCWVGASSEEDACDAVRHAYRAVTTDEDEGVECDDGEEIYEVTLTARKVDAERVEKEKL